MWIKVISPGYLYVFVFQVITAVQRHNQTQVQWSILLDKAFHLEDVAESQGSPVRHFIHSFPSALHHGWIRRFIYTPTVGEFSHYQNLKKTQIKCIPLNTLFKYMKKLLTEYFHLVGHDF